MNTTYSLICLALWILSQCFEICSIQILYFLDFPAIRRILCLGCYFNGTLFQCQLLTDILWPCYTHILVLVTFLWLKTIKTCHLSSGDQELKVKVSAELCPPPPQQGRMQSPSWSLLSAWWFPSILGIPWLIVALVLLTFHSTFWDFPHR